MSATFVSSAAARSADASARSAPPDLAVHKRFCNRLCYDSGAWTVVERKGAGRCLVASRSIAAATKVFSERPIAIAYPEHDEDLIAAVTRSLLDCVQWRLNDDNRFQPAGDFALVCELQSAASARLGSEEWARAVAECNAHGAGGTLIDPAFERRGLLGILSSMMQHECAPSCILHVSGADDGSLMSLHTIRDVAEGEPLSISYIGAYRPTARRREQLQAQHQFLCACARCTSLPELVRAFRGCPACGEGPASPTSPAATCRELHCDNCERLTILGDVAWARLESAERCERCNARAACEGCEGCTVLHEHHHKPALFAQHHLDELAAAARAEALQMHANARQRLYLSFSRGYAHPLVACDVENVAIALLASGDVGAASKKFADAASRYEAFYGAASADAQRCRYGVHADSLDGFKRAYVATYAR